MTETTIENQLTWPPPYTVRKSLRARRTFLQITPTQGLEVVIPNKQKSTDIHALLNEKKEWIEKMLSQIQTDYYSDLSLIERPSLIECKALEETWTVIYEPLPNTKKITLIAHSLPHKVIILKGDTENAKLCHRILIKWLIKYASIFLIAWLKKLSDTTGLFYNQAIIRGQTTLWGSCNAKKNISLNYKLLFLPKFLAQYVLLHELCHIKYLNHSTRFWQYLKTLDANVSENKKILKSAERYLPRWLYCV